ncbi:hypothetical protein KIN20_005359 [Parelaphostrongylus tenuis]|uniref:Uncharacterized protein n=1 Tax=Parelaphostrongylus tenuis TaxID=148309 RepID=A0AAD5LZY9_PARTN|nr:hypothetical protein KIN20_005359 [Parelaphostrongylus tenuis]
MACSVVRIGKMGDGRVNDEAYLINNLWRKLFSANHERLVVQLTYADLPPLRFLYDSDVEFCAAFAFRDV